MHAEDEVKDQVVDENDKVDDDDADADEWWRTSPLGRG